MKRNPSVDARDRGLALTSRINRWMVVGAVGLTGVVSLVASQSFHGRTLSATRASETSSSSSASADSGSSSAAIQQPTQSPSVSSGASVQTGPVVSGGS